MTKSRLKSVTILILAILMIVSFCGLLSKDRYHAVKGQLGQLLSSRTTSTMTKPQETLKGANENFCDQRKTITNARWMDSGKSVIAPPRYHVGVCSSLKYLQSRAFDVYHTWGKEVQSMAFYIGKTQNKTWPADLPVTMLRDVNDTTYPPQKKGFRLLQYWCQHYLETYDWFIKVDDDSYLKPLLLEKLLSGLDEKQMHYFGRRGLGFQFELKQLELYGNTYCCGPTVVYSKALLKGVCPHLDTCLDEVSSNHEDTEIGRCMISKMGLQCGISKKVSLNGFFFHTYNKDYFKGNLSKNKHYKNAISLHAVKSSQDLYNLHFHYRQTSGKVTTAPNASKTNPLSIVPSLAKRGEEMCKKVKCLAPVSGTI